MLWFSILTWKDDSSVKTILFGRKSEDSIREVYEADWFHDKTANVIEQVPVGRNVPKQFFQKSTVPLTSVDKTKFLQHY